MKSIVQLPPLAVLDGLRNVVGLPVREGFSWRRLLAEIHPDQPAEIHPNRPWWVVICDRCSDMESFSTPPDFSFVHVELRQYRQIIARRRDLVAVSYYAGQCARCQTWWWFRVPGYQVLPPSQFRRHQTSGGRK